MRPTRMGTKAFSLGKNRGEKPGRDGKTGDRRDVPQFFDEWKLASVPSVPGLYVPFAQTPRDKDGVPGLLSFTSWAATLAAQDLRGGSTQPAGRSVHRCVRLFRRQCRSRAL